MRQHYPEGEARRAEAILHDPAMLKGALKAPFCYA